MALSADKKRLVRNIGGMKTATVLLADSQTVYEGAIIMRNASGDPAVGADTANCVGMGVAAKAVTSAEGCAIMKSLPPVSPTIRGYER